MKAMNVVYSMIFLTAVNRNISCAQMIIPLYKYPSAYVDSAKTRNLVVPTLNLRLDNRNQLLHSDSILFKPEGAFEFCIYEVVNNQYLLITAIGKSQANSAAIYILPKRKVKVYELGHFDKSWEYDLNGLKLIGIDDKHIVLQNKEGKQEYLSL